MPLECVPLPDSFLCLCSRPIYRLGGGAVSYLLIYKVVSSGFTERYVMSRSEWLGTRSITFDVDAGRLGCDM